MTTDDLALQSAFEQCSAFLSSDSTHARPSTEQKLRLYALYKVAHVDTVTASNDDSIGPDASSKPAMWDLTGRAKWNAWDSLARDLARRYEAGDGGGVREWAMREAKREYVELAEQLGWRDEHARGDQGDADDQKKTVSRGSGQQGMRHVSSIQAEQVDVTSTKVHDLTLDNDADGLRSQLSALSIAQARQLVNATDSEGYAPAHLAADRGFAQVIRVLLEYGADISLEDADGQTPLSLAREAGHDEIVQLLSYATSTS